MNSNLPNDQVPHQEAVRRFLDGLNGDTSSTRREPKGWLPPLEPLVTPEAAKELVAWFAK